MNKFNMYVTSNVPKLMNVDIHRWMTEITFFLVGLVNIASQLFQFKARFDDDRLGYFLTHFGYS